MNIVRISNIVLWDMAEKLDDLDQWLTDNISHGMYVESVGIISEPYRTFIFTNNEDAVAFKLRFSCL